MNVRFSHALMLIAVGIAVPAASQVPYVPTPQPIVDKMLEMAKVTGSDVVYDLGCGDGRIVITAAKKYGARGVGIDNNPQRIDEANANAKEAKLLPGKVKFVEGDLFKFDFSEASVVTLYLLPEVNLELRPLLWKQLRVGTRVISEDYHMGNDWLPEQVERLDGKILYAWTIRPEQKKMAQ